MMKDWDFMEKFAAGYLLYVLTTIGIVLLIGYLLGPHEAVCR